MMKRKVVAFLGTCMFFLGGAFFSQGADQKTANPYERALASNFFAQDAAAVSCGYCGDAYSEIQCEDPGDTYSECETYIDIFGNVVCEEGEDITCSF
ncbi:MAG: hypothetical protein J4F29_19200 [Candidatus Latescibacteria bacterium]|nr:hypothetical protein [Candidatus Latescibacterota bacterium]